VEVIQILHTVGFSEAVSRECTQDIYEAKQLRLAICDRIFLQWLIDLFDFDPKTIGQGWYRNTGT
jgi:hypothetical protein